MKWTTYDGTPETLPPEGIAVLIEEPYGKVLVGVFGEGLHGGVYTLTAGPSLTGLLNPGDRWLPFSVVTPERMEALAEVVNTTRTCLAAYIEIFGKVQWQGRDKNAFARLEQALAKLEALEAAKGCQSAPEKEPQ